MIAVQSSAERLVLLEKMRRNKLASIRAVERYLASKPMSATAMAIHKSKLQFMSDELKLLTFYLDEVEAKPNVFITPALKGGSASGRGKGPTISVGVAKDFSLGEKDITLDYSVPGNEDTALIAAIPGMPLYLLKQTIRNHPGATGALRTAIDTEVQRRKQQGLWI